MNKAEYVARLVVLERATANLAMLITQLKHDLLDEATTDVVASSHEPTTMD